MSKWKRWTPLLALGLIAGTCERDDEAEQGERVIRETPASGFTSPEDPVGATEVARYVGMLEFDTSAVASDAQFFILGTLAAPVIGPWVRIAPEIGSASLTDSSLATGRIIARITVRSGRADPEPSANLYVYARRQGADWVASLLTTDSGTIAGPNAMPLHPHNSPTTSRRSNPRAVWIVAPGGRVTIPITACISCREYSGWCGRDARMWSDPRTWAYLNGHIGTHYPVPSGP